LYPAPPHGRASACVRRRRDPPHEDLVAERIAIDSYREMAHYLGENDSTSRRLMEEILAVEEEHADDLVTLLQELGTEQDKH
jgi:bacterioferritin